MSKNLTRKGLALSAVVALGTSLFAGAPAQAAAALNIAPSAGTSYTVLASDEFTTKVYGNVDFAFATTTKLRWKITKPSASDAPAYADQSATLTRSTDVAADTTNPAIEYVTPTAVTDTLGRNTLKINPATTTAADVTYKIQAYIETDNTVGLNSNGSELASAEQTITFSGTAVPTVTLDQIGINATSAQVTGKLTYAPAINYDLTSATSSVILFTQNGVDKTAVTTAAASSDGTYLKFTGTGAGMSNIAAADVVSVVAKALRFDGDSTYRVSASASSNVGTSTANAVKVSVTKGANIALASGQTTKYVVRKGTKTFSYVVQFKKDTTAVAAGQPVTIKVTATGLADSAGDVVKVNGTTINNANGSPTTINTVTGTDGKVTLSVESNTGNADDALQIETNSGTSATAKTDNLFTWVAADLAAVKEVTAPLANDLTAFTRTIVRLGTYTAQYALVDQFGAKWTSANTSSTYRLNVYRKSGGTNLVSWAALLPTFTDGVANVTITDNATAAAEYKVSVDVQRSQGGTGAWTDESGKALDLSFKTVSALSTPSAITLKEAKQGSTLVSDTDGKATNSAVRATATLARIDRRVDTNTQDKTIATSQVPSVVTISGVVKRADGGVAPGASVTLTAGAGVYFSGDALGENVVDTTITVTADETGVYTAYLFSATGGTKSIVITSGAATATQKIKFAAAAASAGSVITITAPAYTSAGRSVDVTVLLTDENGAPVQSTSASPLRVSVTGAGSYTTIAADSDADGLVSFKLIFGANETGVATIKATYDAENDSTIDITKTATVTIGSAPATAATAAVAGSTGKFYVSVSNAAAKKVVIKVAGKFVSSFTGTAAKKTVVTKATKGSKKVTVYVGGKLVATKTVTVK